MPRNKFTQEFTVKNFLLTHPTPNYFVTSQWRWPRIIYVLYRVVAALYFLVWLVISGSLGGNNVKWFIYLTNWTYLMLTLKTVVMALTALYGYFMYRKSVKEGTLTPAYIDGQEKTDLPQDMPWFLKAQWVIYNMSTSASIIVTLAYWAVLYQPGNPVDAINFNTHAFNSIYVMVDLFVTATPVRLLHVWHVVVYGLIYMIFTLIYCGAGGTNPNGDNWVYSVLDFYGRPVTAVIVALGALLVALPLIWLLIYGLVTLRVFLSEQCCSCCGRNYKGREVGDHSEQRHTIQEQSASPSDEEANPTHESIGTIRPIFTVEATNGVDNTVSNGVVHVSSNGVVNAVFESEKL